MNVAMPTPVRILGTPVDAVTRAEALQRCESFLRGTRLHHVVTANPEMLLHARRHYSYAATLQHADLVLPDGIGLVVAARWSRYPLPERIPGVEFFLELCQLAAREGKRVFLLGGWGGVVTNVADQLRQKIPHLNVSAFTPDHSADAPPAALWDALASIQPGLLFVAYGVPKQERWIAQHRARLESLGVRIALGVGGTFDMLSGRLPRAPHWIRRSGLEWLWRLRLQPRRFPRAFRAAVMFPLAVVRERVLR